MGNVRVQTSTPFLSRHLISKTSPSKNNSERSTLFFSPHPAGRLARDTCPMSTADVGHLPSGIIMLNIVMKLTARQVGKQITIFNKNRPIKGRRYNQRFYLDWRTIFRVQKNNWLPFRGKAPICHRQRGCCRNPTPTSIRAANSIIGEIPKEATCKERMGYIFGPKSSSPAPCPWSYIPCMNSVGMNTLLPLVKRAIPVWYSG